MTRAEQAEEDQNTFVMVGLGSGRSQDFSNWVRGVTLCQSEGNHQIVMSFSPPAVGCLLKKGRLTKGGSWVPAPSKVRPNAFVLCPLWMVILGLVLIVIIMFMS